MVPSDSVRAGLGARSSRALHSILVIEDDPRSGRLMQSILSDLSDEVVLASNAAAALDCLAGSNFSLVTLDLGLPDLPGIDLLRTIREQTDTPIIVVSADISLSTLVTALGAGADDYIEKPVVPAALRARVTAIARRISSRPTEPLPYRDEELTIDLQLNVITRANRPPHRMTRTERVLLSVFLAHSGAVISTPQILRAVWGSDDTSLIPGLHVFMHDLRMHVEEVASHPLYLVTHHGIGYQFQPR